MACQLMRPLQDGDCGLTADAPSMVLEGLREPDPDWQFTDSHGHVHRWRKGKRQTWKWDESPSEPTLAEIIASLWTPPLASCRRCGDDVCPGTRLVDPPPRVPAGPISWEGWLATAKRFRTRQREKSFRLNTFIPHYRGRARATAWRTDAETGLQVIEFMGMGPLTYVA